MGEATRFYVFKIFYNKDAQAEDRPQPSGYSTMEDAFRALYKYMGDSSNTATCGWVMAIVADDTGLVRKIEKWTAPTTETPKE